MHHATNCIVIAWNEIKHVSSFNCYKKENIIPSFHIINIEVIEMEDQYIDDLVALLCSCLHENAHNVKEVRSKIILK